MGALPKRGVAVFALNPKQFDRFRERDDAVAICIGCFNIYKEYPYRRGCPHTKK